MCIYILSHRSSMEAPCHELLASGSGHRAAIMTLWSIPRARRLISPSVDLID